MLSRIHLAGGDAWDVSSTTLLKTFHAAGASSEARSAPSDPQVQGWGLFTGRV